MRCYIDQLPPFAVGFKSENEARKLIIDVTAWKAEHPDMWFEIFVELPEQPGIQYPVPATLNENELTWIISDEFTAVTGEGKYEVFGHSGETLKRTGAQTFTVLESVMEVSVTGVPDVSKPWVDQVLAAREVIANAQSMTAEFSEQAAQHAADAKEAAETVREEIDNTIENMNITADRAEDAADAANKAAQSASASAVNADTAARGAYEAQAQALEAIDQVRDTLEDLNMIGERVSDAGVDAANAAVQASAAAERANSVADVVMSTAGAAASDAAEAVKAAREATAELIKNANDEVGEAVRDANEAAANVQDGGYYEPHINAAGQLMWRPSKDGMPFPDSVNIRGPVGPEGPMGPEGPEGPQGPKGDATFVVNLVYDSSLKVHTADKSITEIAEAATTSKVVAVSAVGTSTNVFELVQVTSSGAVFARLNTLYNSSSGAVSYHAAHGYVVSADGTAKIFTTRLATNSEVPKSVVQYVSQSLTDAQKAQARENIGVGNEYTNSLIDKGAQPIVADARGSVIAAGDSADRAVRKLTIYGRTTQNGTPTPSTPRPLSTVGADGDVKVSAKNGLPEGGNEHITIITQPRSISAPVNTNVVFSVVAKGEGLTYQWEYSSSGGASWANSTMASATSSELTVVARAYLDGYPYRCLIKDKNGNKLYTNEVVLTIAGDTTVYDNPATVQTATITTPDGLPGVPVTSGGNYIDANGQQWIADTVEYNADTGKAEYVKRVEIGVLDETAGWKKSSNANVDRYYVAIGQYDKVKVPAMLCNIGLVGTTSNSMTAVGQVGIDSNRNFSYNYAASGASTLDGFLTHIANNPIMVAYPITNHIKTELSAEETAQIAALKTYYPETTVYNEDGAHMEIKYVADTKTYIDKKIEMLAAARLNNV